MAVDNKEDSVQGDQQKYEEPWKWNGEIFKQPRKTECNEGAWFI